MPVAPSSVLDPSSCQYTHIWNLAFSPSPGEFPTLLLSPKTPGRDPRLYGEVIKIFGRCVIYREFYVMFETEPGPRMLHVRFPPHILIVSISVREFWKTRVFSTRSAGAPTQLLMLLPLGSRSSCKDRCLFRAAGIGQIFLHMLERTSVVRHVKGWS